MRIAFGNGAEPAKFTYLPVATRLHQHADVARGSGLNSNVFIIPAVLPFGLGDPFNTSIFIIFPVLL